MIQSIEVINHLGESLVLELRSPEKSGLLVRSITGITPTNASVNVSEMATIDGGIVNSEVRTTYRNIVISLGFMFCPSIEDSRLLTYRYFPVKRKLRLKINTDKRSVYTEGYVESNEPDIFSSESSTQISIVCPDPNLYDISLSTIIFSGRDPMFEFPFSNESLTENLIELSRKKEDYSETIQYSGDSDIGFIMTVHALGEARNITIYNSEMREFTIINTDKIKTLTGIEFGSTDDLIISSIPGNRYVKLLRNGIYTNVLNCVDRTSDWLKLRKGLNTIAYTAEEGKENLEFKIEYRTAYEGV